MQAKVFLRRINKRNVFYRHEIFLKRFLKRLAVTLVTSVLFAILSIFILGALITSLLEESEVVHESNSVLTLNLSMNLTDRRGGFQLQDLTRQALADKVDPPQLHLWEFFKLCKKPKMIKE